MENKNLDEWLFNYSSDSGLWRAVRRDDQFLLFNDVSNEKVLKSKELNTLIEGIYKGKI